MDKETEKIMDVALSSLNVELGQSCDGQVSCLKPGQPPCEFPLEGVCQLITEGCGKGNSFVKFAGVFHPRNNQMLSRSGFCCLEVAAADRQKIIKATSGYMTTMLMFGPPDGDWLRWVVWMGPLKWSYSKTYENIRHDLLHWFDIETRAGCSDVAHCWGLCHDPGCYIGSKRDFGDAFGHEDYDDWVGDLPFLKDGNND